MDSNEKETEKMKLVKGRFKKEQEICIKKFIGNKFKAGNEKTNSIIRVTQIQAPKFHAHMHQINNHYF